MILLDVAFTNLVIIWKFDSSCSISCGITKILIVIFKYNFIAKKKQTIKTLYCKSKYFVEDIGVIIFLENNFLIYTLYS